MVLLLWLIIGVFVVFQYHRESGYKTRLMQDQLSAITNRVIYYYERDLDLNQFINFIGQFYDGSIFDELKISVYDSNGDLLYNLGEAIPLDAVNTIPSNNDSGMIKHADDKSLFYLTSTQSNDGQINVLTAMPYTISIYDAIAFDPRMWIVIGVLVLVVTVVAYYSTRLLTRNITLLQAFARRASRGETFKDIDRFSHDELGDISREIIKLYREKQSAMLASEREHSIAIHAIEEKARIKRQLTNNINHELKTPIGVIRGYIDTILDDPDMDSDARTHFLRRTQQNVERLCSLLNDVSTITRLDESGKNIPVSKVDMHDLLYSIENDVIASHIAPNMTFSFDLPFDCSVVGNESLLNGMLMNLIKNASIHSHGTEMGFKLVSESAKYYTFAFYDNGTGVADTHLSHLFERFYRIDSGRSRKVGGTGLGLPIVKNTIQSLGGSISVHNRSTGGLEFVFTLIKWNASVQRTQRQSGSTKK